MIFPVIISLLIAAGVAHAAPAAPSMVWSPKDMPESCRVADVRILLADVSGSMFQRHLQGPASEQLADYVVGSPDCAYVVYGDFGLTADVRSDAWLTGPDDRAALVRAIREKPRQQKSTNLDEAAKLIDLIVGKVVVAFSGMPIAVTAVVVSDFVASPSEGKEPFDLRAFLAPRTDGLDANIVRVQLVSHTTTTPLVLDSNGVMVVSVDRLTEALRAADPPARLVVSSSSPEVTASPAASMATSEAPWRVIPLIVAVIIAVAAAVAWGLRRFAGAPPDIVAVEPAPAPQLPRGFRITEHRLGSTPGDKGSLVGRWEVPAAAGLPITISAEPSAEVRVSPVAGAPGRLFTLTLDRQGVVHVAGVAGAAVDGEPLSRSGSTFSPGSGARLRIGDRQWEVSGIWRDAALRSSLLAVSATPAQEVSSGEVGS